MLTLKVQGQVYHMIGNLLPTQGPQLEVLQIYFFSHAEEVPLRSNLKLILQKYSLIARSASILHMGKNKISIRNRGQNVDGFPGVKKDTALGHV